MTRPGTGRRPHTLVVGASLAGLTVARTLRERCPDAPITLLGDEGEAPYDRPPLSKQLLLDPEAEPTPLVEPEWFVRHDVELLTGHRATSLDPVRHVVGGERWERRYDRLVVATGARARRLPAPLHHPGVWTLRTRRDSLRLRSALRTGHRLVVVGAGFIGLEVAAAARRLGVCVSVVDEAPVPLSRALGAEAGTWFRRLHERQGVRMHLGRTVTAITPARRGSVVALDDGSTLPADVVLAAVGAVPNVEWTHGLLGEVAGGVRCDSLGRTESPDVWAVGDAAAWYVPRLGRHLRVEHWATAVEQGRAVGECLAGVQPGEPRTPSFWSDQHDAKARFVGYPGTWDSVEVEHGPQDSSSLLARYTAADRLVGVLAVNRPRDLVAAVRELDRV